MDTVICTADPMSVYLLVMQHALMSYLWASQRYPGKLDAGLGEFWPDPAGL